MKPLKGIASLGSIEEERDSVDARSPMCEMPSKFGKILTAVGSGVLSSSHSTPDLGVQGVTTNNLTMPPRRQAFVDSRTTLAK